MTECKPSRRRRWLRYSMRTMLVAVTLLCLVLALVIVPAERQRRTVRKIRASDPHSMVRYDFEVDGQAGRSSPAWLRRWLGDDYFHRVVSTEIYLSRGDLTPDDLTNLPALKHLTTVRMPLADDGLQTLTRLRNLESLSIYSDSITDRGIEQLSSLTELELLNVNSNQVTGEGLRPLAALKNLRRLILRSNSITVDGLEAVARLSNLESLQLNSDSLTDECLKTLSGMEGLTGLTIDGRSGVRNAPPGVTDESLRHIAQLSNLQTLSISSPGITDVGLAHLTTLRKLSKLSIAHSDAKYTEAAVIGLLTRIPGLVVEYRDPSFRTGLTIRGPLKPAQNNPPTSR